MRQFYFFLIAIMFSGSLFSQCYLKNTCFKAGENVTYNVTYNWGFIWIDAGEVIFKIDSGIYDNKPVLKFSSSGRSYPNYDWIFKVRDTYSAWTEKETIIPLKFERINNEGSSSLYNKYIFNHITKKVYIESKTNKSPLKKDSLKLENCSMDLLTAVYHCRNIDFSKLNLNETVPLQLYIDDGFYSLYIRYLGKEEIELLDDNGKYRCIKFKMKLIEGSMFNEGENMTIWVTDDKNKLPVMIEAKILVGNVKVIAKKMLGLKYKTTAKLD